MTSSAPSTSSPIPRGSIATTLVIIFLSFAVIALGYNYFYRPFWNKWQAEHAANNPVAARQAASDSGTLKNGLVANLSAQEKIAQLLVVPVAAVVKLDKVASATSSAVAGITPTGAVPQPIEQVLDPATVAWLQTYKPGFVQLIGAKTSTASSAVQPLSMAAAVATSRAVDQAALALPWPFIKVVRHSAGDSQTLRGTGFTVLPTMAQLCLGENKYEAALAASATELSKLKISVVIGPVIDLRSEGGFQGNQVCADPAEVVTAAQKYIENFGSVGIMPVLAHFPGIGQAQQSPQRQSQTLSVAVSELKPFQQLLKTYPNLGVIVSPVKVTGKFNDQPCVFSSECLAAFGKDFPQALVIADSPVSGVSQAVQVSQISQASASANFAAAATPSASTSLATAIKQSLLAGNHIVVIDPKTSWSDLTSALQQLTTDYQTDLALQQAVEAGWQHVLALRAGKT